MAVLLAEAQLALPDENGDVPFLGQMPFLPAEGDILFQTAAFQGIGHRQAFFSLYKYARFDDGSLLRFAIE
ncbi:MAG TPA: hypothetical protein PK878_08120 [bacterium]|nr:hypothetical protein [Candidatus Omnitrophota bacterium]HOJ60240.1 hypothetical protein [bacterium]HXK94528.1 hypothetical protein [bacterium]